jgi:hypothetical protein
MSKLAVTPHPTACSGNLSLMDQKYKMWLKYAALAIFAESDLGKEVRPTNPQVLEPWVLMECA